MNGTKQQKIDPVNAPTISKRRFRDLIQAQYPKAYDVIEAAASGASLKRPSITPLKGDLESVRHQVLTISASTAMRSEIEDHRKLRHIGVIGDESNPTLICMRGDTLSAREFAASLPHLDLDELTRQFPHGMEVVKTLKGKLAGDRLYINFSPKQDMDAEIRDLMHIIANPFSRQVIESELDLSLAYRDPRSVAAKKLHSSPPEWNMFVSIHFQAANWK